MGRVAVLFFVVLGACGSSDDESGLGSQCIEGTRVFDCGEGLYCSSNNGRCKAVAQLGEACKVCDFATPCDTPCDDRGELFCGRTDTCELPHDVGGDCASNFECAEGLFCNQGALPDDAYLGICQAAPSAAGQPCFYARFDGSPEGKGYGCGPGLVCVPPLTTRAVMQGFETNQLCNSSEAAMGICGYTGVCAAPLGGASGDACLGDDGCSNNTVCNVLPPPLGADYAPGFVCDERLECSWGGPWTGRCASPSAPKSGQSCASAACAPGFLCDWLGVCRAAFLGELLARCDTFTTAAMDDNFCEYGRHCEMGPNAPICRPGEAP